MSPVSVGNRHSSQGAPPKGWNCPSCGSANAGPLELGCAVCGSGKPGEHVGVPPRAAPMTAKDLQNHLASTVGMVMQMDPPVPEQYSAGSLEIAFRQFCSGKDYSFDDRQLAFEAFKAGYEMALATVVQTAPLPGTAESRTIVMGLKLFMEHILPMAAEEVANGEFLGRQAVEDLIRKLERTS